MCMKKRRAFVKNYLFLNIIFFSLIALISCSSARQHHSWRQAMTSKLALYKNNSNQHFRPYFKQASVIFPPKNLAFLIFKESKLFEVWAKNNNQWSYIESYPILGASGRLGPKLHSGDRQVPEGIYKIVGLNPESQFDLSMHINYPNEFDKQYADFDHRARLGGDIYIHGDKRSIGCIAIGDHAIEQLFPLVYRVGMTNVSVIIAPNDLRKRNPKVNKKSPEWASLLYQRIARELRKFKRRASRA